MNNKIEINNPILSKPYMSNIVPYNVLDQPIEFISTGNILLDNEIGGGIPKGRITEIFGGESSGKTTLALEIAKQCAMRQKNVLYLDLEYSLNTRYVKKLGINTDYFYIAQAKNGEIAFDLINDAINSKNFDLIIVDSVAAMLPEEEMQNKIEDTATLGVHARLMSRGVRKIQSSLAINNTAIVFINQLRDKIGVFFGNPETTTGGKALKYYSSLRLEVKKTDLIKNNQGKIGIKSKVTAVKNKIQKPFGSTFINIYFGDGFDSVADILEYAIEINLIKKLSSWYSYEDKNICQGFTQLKNYAKENPEWFEQIKTIIYNDLKVVKD